MTRFASKFDITTEDPHPNAQAGLLTVLDVDDTLIPSPPRSTEGTPIPGVIPAGSVVEMKSTGNGKAVLGFTPDPAAAEKKLFFVTVDGDMDFDGANFHRITCIQGGMRITTDQFVTNVLLLPGKPLTVGTAGGGGGDNGKFKLKTSLANEQCYGYVGPEGYDATNGTLDVIIPQGTV